MRTQKQEEDRVAGLQLWQALDADYPSEELLFERIRLAGQYIEVATARLQEIRASTPQAAGGK